MFAVWPVLQPLLHADHVLRPGHLEPVYLVFVLFTVRQSLPPRLFAMRPKLLSDSNVLRTVLFAVWVSLLIRCNVWSVRLRRWRVPACLQRSGLRSFHGAGNTAADDSGDVQIGRASCRERVYVLV